MGKTAGGVKFCPKCGTQNSINDAYCIKCGFNFSRKAKKQNSNVILLVLILAIGAWIFLRIYLKKPIIPQEAINFVKTTIQAFTNKTG
jgi:uncharacterized membrane protein YvbJ